MKGIIRRWVDDAACLDLLKDDIFFPEQSALSHIKRRKTREAKAICGSCVVTSECLEDALLMPKADDVAGVRGGLTKDERDKYREEHAVKRNPDWRRPRIHGQPTPDLPSETNLL